MKFKVHVASTCPPELYGTCLKEFGDADEGERIPVPGISWEGHECFIEILDLQALIDFGKSVGHDIALTTHWGDDVCLVIEDDFPC